MEEQIIKIQEDIEAIKKRNVSVETNKAWEKSFTRIVSISIITYIVALIVMHALGAQHVFFNALVPVFGFILSTQSLPFIKKIWMKHR